LQRDELVQEAHAAEGNLSGLQAVQSKVAELLVSTIFLINKLMEI